MNTWRGAVLGLVVFVGTGEAIANSISNPSFEQFTGAYGGDGGAAINPGNTSLTNWTIVGNEVAVIKTPNQYLITASDGLNFLDLVGYGNTVGRGISQTISGLSPGQQYRFSADLGISNNPSCVPGSTCGGPVSVLVNIASSSQTLAHNSALAGVVWANYGFNFTATSTSHSLTVTGSALPPGGAFIGLDNLSLVPVPEPAAAVAACTALILAALCRCRIRRG